MKSFIQKIDPFLNYSISSLKERVNMFRRRHYYNRKLNFRKSIYGEYTSSSSLNSLVETINRNGYVVLRDFVDKTSLTDIDSKFNKFLNSGDSLLKVSNDSLRDIGDESPSKFFLDTYALAQGQNYCRQYTNNMALKDPLISIPEICDIAFSDSFIEIASSYFGVIPALGSLNLRKSFANGLPAFDTQYFHVDPNSIKFLKFFLYLSDVDEKSGPFTYIKGSHKNKFPGWQRKYRWTYNEIINYYDETAIVKLTGKVGDLIIADTNGFHRGEALHRNDRTMLTLDYLIHEEFDGTSEKFKISLAEFEKNINKAALCDFLKVV